MRFLSIRTVTCAAALLVGVSVSPVVARQSGPRDASGAVTPRPELQSQRPPLGPGEEELEGTLEVLIEDHPRGTVVHKFLDTSRGRLRLLEALGDSDLNGMVTGQRVRARGRRSQDGNSLELKPGASSSGDSSVTTVAPATNNTFGQQRVLVIMVNFQDNTALSTNYGDAYQTTFGGVSAFYQENSYGQTYLTGDVVGTYTLPLSSSVCDYNKIASLGEQAAANAGVNVNSYPRRVFAFPNNACGWWGLGNVGGNPSRSWINGSYTLKVVAHALGHNFGGWHSNSQPCQNGACSVSQYGDDRDMMGAPGQGHLNAYQKERLGWLNYGASPAIQMVTASGSYFISALQSTDAAPKALRVLRTAAAGANEYYYVEARAQVGFDAGYPPGVVIHTGNESNGNTSLQVDLDPFTSAFDPLLDPGQSYTDGVRNITFRTMSVDATGAWVSVQLPAAPCTMRSPNVTLSPSGTLSAPGGVAKPLTLTVKNNDDHTCTAAVFAPQISMPGGWTWTTSHSAMTLAPGVSTSITLHVTPSFTATGSTAVMASAARTNSSGPGNATSVTMTIPAPTPAPAPTPTPAQTPTPTLAPTAPADLAVSLVTATSGAQFTLTATVRNNGALTSGLTVKFSAKDPRGTVQNYTAITNSLGVATVKGRMKPKDVRGAYVVTATGTFGGSTSTSSAGFIY